MLCCVCATTEIRISFERERYDVQEREVELNNTIHLIKENDRISEQTLEVFVNLTQSSGPENATIGI